MYTKLPALFIAFILCILLPLDSYAQPTDTLFLWPGKVPGETREKHFPVQTDNTSRNVTRLTDVTNPALIVFEPEKPNNSGAGIIICPGGGYQIIAINIEGFEIATWFNKLGYTAFVLQYRVPDNRQGALMDIQRAIRTLRSRYDEYKLEKTGVIGFSAGGNLCAQASIRFVEETYPAVDYIDTLSARPDFTMLIYPAYLDSEGQNSLSPELTLSDQTPPFFIFGTADDKYGNSALVMTAALRNNNSPVELHFWNEGGHGYGMRTGNNAAETWPRLISEWLESID